MSTPQSPASPSTSTLLAADLVDGDINGDGDDGGDQRQEQQQQQQQQQQATKRLSSGDLDVLAGGSSSLSTPSVSRIGTRSKKQQQQQQQLTKGNGTTSSFFHRATTVPPPLQRHETLHGHWKRVDTRRKEFLKAERPQALSIADRFPMLSYVSEALETETTRKHHFCSLFTIFFWMLVLIDLTFCCLYIVERVLLERTAADSSASAPAPASSSSGSSRPHLLTFTERPIWLYVALLTLSFVVLLHSAIRLARYKAIDMPRSALILYTVFDVITCGIFFVSIFNLPEWAFLYSPYYLRFFSFLGKVETGLRSISHNLGERNTNPVVEQIVLIVMTMIGFVFSGMCAVNWADNYYSTTTNLTIFNSFYFMIVTVSTVGYGDVTPQSEQGRGIVMAVIILALFVIPTQISALTEAIAAQRALGASVSVTESDFVVVIVSLKYDTPVLDALRELIPEHQGTRTVTRRIALLDTNALSPAMQLLLKAPFYRTRVQVINGSAMSDGDLSRARVKHAKAVFLIADKYDGDTTNADQRNMLRAWSIMTHAPQVPLYMLNLSHLAQRTLTGAKVVQSAMFNKELTLAAQCLYRGLGTFLCNLWRHGVPIHSHTPWVDMYGDGVSNELFEITLPESFAGVAYLDLIKSWYETFSVVVVAVKTTVRTPEGETMEHIVLNPTGPTYDLVLRPNDTILYIGRRSIPLASITAPLQLPVSLDPALRVIRRAAGAVPEPLPYSPPDRHPETVARLVPIEQFLQSTHIGFPHHAYLSSAPECILNNEPTPYELAHLKRADHLNSHVIVIGNMERMFAFVCSLRLSNLRLCEIAPILFFTDKLPSKAVWKHYAQFPFVYFVKGDPLSVKDLDRAGLKSMRRVCVVSQSSADADEEAMVDAQVIACTHNLIEVCGTAQHKYIVTELMHRDNYSFIPPILRSDIYDEDKLAAEFRYRISPAYASGRIVSTSMLDSVLFQTYNHRPNLPAMFNLMNGWKLPQQYALDDLLGVGHARICTIELPTEIIEQTGVTYRDVFRLLVNKYFVVPLGLYRNPNTSFGNDDFNFVYTNPLETIHVHQTDRVFVLSAGASNAAFLKAHAEKQ